MHQSICISTYLYLSITLLHNFRLVFSSMEYVTLQRGEEGTECSIAKFGATLTSWKVIILAPWKEIFHLEAPLGFFILILSILTPSSYQPITSGEGRGADLREPRRRAGRLQGHQVLNGAHCICIHWSPLHCTHWSPQHCTHWSPLEPTALYTTLEPTGHLTEVV